MSTLFPDIPTDSIFHAEFERLRMPGKIRMRGPEGICDISFPGWLFSEMTDDKWKLWEQKDVMSDGQWVMGTWPDPDNVSARGYDTEYMIQYDSEHMPVRVEAYNHFNGRVLSLKECKELA